MLLMDELFRMSFPWTCWQFSGDSFFRRLSRGYLQMILEISLRWIKVTTIVRQNFNLTRVRCKWYCCYNTHLVVEYFDWHFSQRRKHEGKESLIGILYLTAFQSNTLINWHKTLQNTKISLCEIPWKTCSCSLSPLPWYLT